MSEDLLTELRREESPLHDILIRANKFSSLIVAHHVIDSHPLYAIENAKGKWQLNFVPLTECCNHFIYLYLNYNVDVEDIYKLNKPTVLTSIMSTMLDPDGVMMVTDGVTRVDSPRGWLEIF